MLRKTLKDSCFAKKNGEFYAVASAFSYGLVGFFGKKVMNYGLSVQCMLFWRFFVASFIILAFYLSKKNFKLKEIHNLFQFDKSSVISTLFFGVTSITFFISSVFIGTGLAMVIFYTYPLFVILLAIVINKQQISKSYYLSFLLIILGIILLNISQELKFELSGILVGILSAFLYGAYLIISQNQLETNPIASTFSLCLGCAIICLIASLIDQSFSIPNYSISIIYIILIAIVCTVMPIWLLLKALETISATKASLLSAYEPVVVLAIGYYFLNEKLNGWQILGAFFIIIGALIVNMDKKFK